MGSFKGPTACQVPKSVKDMARRFEDSQRTEVKRSLEMEVAPGPWCVSGT